MALIEMNLNASPVKDVIPALLFDRTTKKNIIFATDSYAEQSTDYSAKNHITEQALSDLDIRPRVLKNAEEQVLRTRKRAEVFTPAWVCCMMNNHADTVWFGRNDVFGVLNDTEWIPSAEPVRMPKRKRWQTYVDARRFEITCGEAPYLVSRYDMGTGEVIPIENRIGILDRKLRIVNENASDEAEWLKWALRSLQAVYGYEYQGDNLLIARVNLLMTFVENLQSKWKREASPKELREAAKVISWNIWQMDGLKAAIPMGPLYERYHQRTLFEMYSNVMGVQQSSCESIPCRIYDWRGQNQSVQFNAFREGRNGSMKFDFIVGNPPYQDETLGDNKGFAPPIYDKFMDAAYEVADKVELIHPARFLFNAGSTPKAWNRKMLEDEHFQILLYEADASILFAGVEIKGGVAVSYRDRNKTFGAIKVFLRMQELNDILKKVSSKKGFTGLDEIAVSRTVYRLTEKFHSDHPEARYKEDEDGKNIGCLSKGHDYDMATNIFERMPQVFFDECPKDSFEYIQVLGREGNDRVYKWIRKEYVNAPKPLYKWSIVLPKANNTGQFGEVLSQPVVTAPNVGSTETFLSVGFFETEIESRNCLKYVSTKFAKLCLVFLKQLRI